MWTDPLAIVAASVVARPADDRDVIISGSRDHTVRIWDADTRRCRHVLELLGPATACAVGDNGRLCVAVGGTICTFRRR